MSEFSLEDDPDPLPELRNGLHYYNVHDFLRKILRQDSRHTLQYREWYPICDEVQGQENDGIDQVSDVSKVKVPIGRTSILRRLGRFAHFAVFE